MDGLVFAPGVLMSAGTWKKDPNIPWYGEEVASVQNIALDIQKNLTDHLLHKIDALTDTMKDTEDFILQEVGKALDYPWHKDDQQTFPGSTEEDGICTGQHIAETIVMELIERYKQLKQEIGVMQEAGVLPQEVNTGVVGNGLSFTMTENFEPGPEDTVVFEGAVKGWDTTWKEVDLSEVELKVMADMQKAAQEGPA